MKKLLLFSSILFGLLFAANISKAQVAALSYPGSPYSLPVSTAASIPAPTNSGGAVNGGYTNANTTQIYVPADYVMAVTTDAAAVSYIVQKTNVGGAYAPIYKVVAGAGSVLTISGVTLVNPNGIAIDGNGNLFISDIGPGVVYEFTLNAGKTTATLAATIGTPNAKTNGGLYTPVSIGFDASNNVYIADQQNGGTASGVIFKVAQGTTTVTSYITGLNNPYGVAVDALGNTYVSQNTANNILKINVGAGTRTTLAGTYSGPRCLTTNATNDVFICDYGDGVVKEMSAAGVASSLITATAEPSQVSFDPSRDMYIADFSSGNLWECTPTTYYTISGTLPTGLTFNTTTGAITGTTNATVVAATSYTVTAYNQSGISTCVIIISVNKTTGVPTISYSPSTFAYTQGTAIPTFPTPTTTGAATITFSISPGLPAGLTFSAANGKITGTPTAYSPSTTYTIAATNTSGSGYTTISIAVTGTAPTLTYTATYNEANNTAITITPTTTGTVTSTTISPTLPAGLSISSTGVISGSTAATGTTGPYTVVPMNGTTTGTANTFTLTFNVAPAFSYTSEYRPAEGAAVSLAPTVTAGSPTSYAETGSALGTLTFNTTTGTFGGTAAANTTTLTFTVTATNAAGLTAQYTVVIRPITPAPFTYTNPAAYTAGTAIATLSPSVTTLTLATISPALPAGLTISASGVITGTPTAASASTVYTVFAYTTAGYYASATVTISVVAPPPPILTYAGTPLTYTANVSNTTEPITNTGAAVVGTYTITILTGSLPAGITFNSANGTFTVVPTAAGAFTATVAGTNGGGTSTANISITVGSTPAPTISYTTNNTFTTGAAITTLAPTVTNAPTSYTFNGTLPAGLLFSTTNGQITGTPTVTQAATSYTVTASNSGGPTTSASFFITIVNPPVFSYTAPPTYTVGTAITALSPNITSGGPLTGATISPTLPAGLAISASGVISGTPTAAAAAQTYTITAVGSAGGTGTATVSITVYPAQTTISYSASSYTYTVGTTITTLVPTVTGSPTSYSYTGTLPAGLTFSTTSGQITGTPTTATTLPSPSIVVSAINGNPTAGTFTITFVVNPKPPVIAYTTPDTYTAGAVVSLSPNNTGGAATWSVTSATPLPAGLSINTATGLISGTATTYLAQTSYTIQAVGSTTVTQTIKITVNQAPVILYNPNTYSFTVGTAIPTTIIPGNTGGPVAGPGAFGAGTNLANVSAPAELAIDRAGNLYSADYGYDRIRKYTNATGTPANFGPTFTFLVGVATDASNNVYALDNGTQLVTKYNSGGTAQTFTSPTFDDAVSIATDPNGNVYVADNGANAVYGLTPTGTVFETITTNITSPEAIAVDPSGNLYVLNNNGFNAATVTKYNTSGTYVSTTTLPAAYYPFALAVDGAGNVYIGDSNAGSVYEYNSSNMLVTTINAGGFTDPDGIAVDAKGDVFVADDDNGTITEFSPLTAYSVNGPLPPGITFSTTTGQFSGTPTQGFASETFTVYAYNATGSGSTQITFTCPTTTPLITYTTPDVYTVGTAITPTLTPANTGGPVTVYSISPNLPAGLLFNPNTGVISGTPTAASVATNYSVTATNSNGSYIATVNITVYPQLPAITYNPASYSFTAGVAGSTAGPGNTGGAVVTYSFDSTTPPPAYLTINSSTGVISVSSASVTTAAATYTIDATNANPTTPGDETTITITILTPPSISYSPSNPYTVGLTLSVAPSSSGSPIGTTGLTYSSVAYATTGLNEPWGETFDASGNLYAVDEGTNNTVNEYNSGGGYLGNFITNTGGTTLANPTGIVFYGNNAYISTIGGYVYEYSAAGVYMSTIVTGGNGTAAKPESIYGLAVDGTGDLYMTDNTSGYIYKYTAGGTTAIIAKYTNTTGLFDPTGIAVSAAGNVYFVDSYDNNLVELSPTGAYIATISNALNSPYGLSIDASGNFYVSNTGNALVDIFSSTGTLKNTFTTTGTDPQGIIADANGNIYVSDYTANTVTKYFLSSGYTLNSGVLPPGVNFSTVTGTFSGTPTAASGPTTYSVTGYNAAGASSTTTVVLQCSVVAPNITYTPNTENYPINQAIASLAPVNSGGGIIANNTGFGTGTVFATIAAANEPWGMTNDAYGDIFVADYGAKAIIEYNSTGSTILSLSTATYSPTGVAVDASGNIYAIMSNGYIYKWNSSGTGGLFSTTIRTTDGNFTTNGEGIAVDASGNLYITDDKSGYIWKYTVGAAKPVKFVAATLPTGIVTDAASNFYFVDLTTKALKEYNSAGTLVSGTIVTGLNTPYGLYRDAAGHFFIGGSTAAGSVTEYSSTGTVITTLTSQTSPRGMVTDNQGNLYVSDYTAGNITEYPANLYSINTAVVGALPAGITFNVQTGTFSGTPTANFGPITYTITCNGYGSTTASTTVTITCYTSYDWVGTTSTDWNTTTNWASLTVPTSANTANIGVNVAFTKQPNVGSAGTNSVAAVQIGNTGGQAVTLTVTSPYTLAVVGNVIKQSDANSSLGYAATLTGSGTITAANLNIIGSTAAASAYTETLSSSITNLTLSGTINLTSNLSTNAENATFNLTGGTTTATGALTTTNVAGSTSTFNITSTTTATLNVANTTFLSGLSANGTNVFTLGAGSVLGYAGAAQTLYTTAAIANLSGGSTGLSYQGISFSGTGIKTPTSGNLNVAGNFTNTMPNDAADYVSLTSTPVFFNGAAAQSLAGGGGNGTVFGNVTFNGGGQATMTGGMFYVSSTSALTMVNGPSTGSSLNAGGFLTLNSDVNGCASVAQIPAGSAITGTVNVQRYISGERGYRLLSSPVYAGSQNGNYIYSINYLVSNPTLNNNIYLTGPSFATTGTTAAGNPSVYLYDEGFVPQYTTFYNSNFIAVSSLSAGTGTDPAYAMYSPNGATTPAVGGTYNIPVGNGVYVFFRGNMSEGVANLTNPSYTPIVPATVVASGSLTQGKITFADWYTPTSTALGGISQNYNLIGNPYASAIDLASIQGALPNSGIYITPYNGTTGIAKFIYELNPLSGSYGIYTYDGSAPATNGAIEFIGSGEGFMVQAYGSGSQLIFNENAKATSTNATNYGEMARRVANFNPVKINPLLDLKMSADSIHVEETILSFNPNASSKYVFNEDAPHKAGVGIVGISSMSSDNMKLAINSQPLQANMTIPLNVNATVSGLYNINLNQIAPLPSIYEVWLKDAYKKDSLDIKDNPVYNFDINVSDTTTYGSNRFSLVIRENPALMVHLLSFNATKAIANVNVAWTTENEQNYTNFTVERSTDGGTTFTNLGALTSTAIGAYNYVDRNPAIGANMYRLMIVDLSGAVSYSNIVTIMFSNTSNQLALNGMTVYPNPTANMVNLSITQTTSANVTASLASASYKIEIVNNLGVVVRNATSTAPTWTSDVTSLSPGTYFISVVNASNNAIVGKSAFVKL